MQEVGGAPVDLGAAVVPTDPDILKLLPNTLRASATYRVELRAADAVERSPPRLEGSASLELRTCGPPRGGSVRVEPAAGVEMLTSYTVTMGGWLTDAGSCAGQCSYRLFEQRPNATATTFELVRKPVLNAMALLAKLGDRWHAAAAAGSTSV